MRIIMKAAKAFNNAASVACKLVPPAVVELGTMKGRRGISVKDWQEFINPRVIVAGNNSPKTIPIKLALIIVFSVALITAFAIYGLIKAAEKIYSRIPAKENPTNNEDIETINNPVEDHQSNMIDIQREIIMSELKQPLLAQYHNQSSECKRKNTDNSPSENQELNVNSRITP